MKRSAVILFVFAVLLLFSWGFYQWFFCRFYVPPKYMAVVTAKTGKTPAPGTILVERGEKGIWREVLPEGRHFLDPFLYDVKIVPAVVIPLGKVGIVTSKVGKPLPPGGIIAPDRSSQGVWRDALGPGLYRLNPQGYEVEIADAINIPIGYVGVVTSQTGKPAPAGQFASQGEKGVLKDILQPGLYYINPRAYQVNVIEIGMNQISMLGREGSVIELKNSINAAGSALREMSYNTLNQQKTNRQAYVDKSSMLDTKSVAAEAPRRNVSSARSFSGRQRVAPGRRNAGRYREPAMLKKKAPAPLPANKPVNDVVYSINTFVEFPSRDGFKISMDMTVEFELMPESVSKVYMLYGDLPQVVEKIILPQVLSASRLKGSSYKAQDFIMGEGRETFQMNLRKALTDSMKEKNIIIRNAIIRSVSIPRNILKPIQDSSLAVEQNLTNFALQETAKIEAELNQRNALIDQKRREVEQNTRKLVAETAAKQKNAVRMIEAQTELEVAEIQLKRSEIEAKREKLRGETLVKTEFMKRNETALGTKMKADILGKAGILSDMKLVDFLNPDIRLKIIYAGDGTFWTDMKSGAVSIQPKK